MIGDRSGLLDGKSVENPTWRFFQPLFDTLRDGDHAAVSQGTPSTFDVHSGDDWGYEKGQRTILAEEIKGLLVQHVPGASADDKARKSQLLYTHFGTRSWTQIEKTDSARLSAGLAALRAALEPPAEEMPPDDMRLPDWGGGD